MTELRHAPLRLPSARDNLPLFYDSILHVLISFTTDQIAFQFVEHISIGTGSTYFRLRKKTFNVRCSVL